MRNPRRTRFSLGFLFAWLLLTAGLLGASLNYTSERMPLTIEVPSDPPREIFGEMRYYGFPLIAFAETLYAPDAFGMQGTQNQPHIRRTYLWKGVVFNPLFCALAAYGLCRAFARRKEKKNSNHGDTEEEMDGDPRE